MSKKKTTSIKWQIFNDVRMISIIIVNYKSWDRLSRCLESLAIIEDIRFQFEVIVVDNHSNDGKVAEFVLLFPKFIFISNTGNNGFANGCNLGAVKSNGSHLLFLNPDTTVTADALYDMLEEVRVRPEYSIVSCRQVRENGSEDRPYGKFLTIFTLTGWLRAIHQLFYRRLEDSIVQTKHYIYPDWVSGSVILIKKDSFFRLGKWDEDFWMYFEDVDLCRRAHLKNGEIVIFKRAIIGHIHGGSSRINREVTVLTKTEVNISRHVYISKHVRRHSAFFMHLLLIINNLLLGLLPALVGIVFFFIPEINIYSQIYFKLAGYYLQTLKSGRWVSVRSVNYTKKNKSSEMEPVYLNYEQVYP